MVRIIDSATIDKKAAMAMDPEVALWFYCGMDAACTREILDKLLPLLNDTTRATYEMSLAQRGPALSMMLRGTRIDPIARQEEIERLDAIREHLRTNLDQLAEAVWGKGLNPDSPIQLKALFYDFMGIGPYYKIEKGRKRITTERAALERVRQHFYAMPLVNHVLAFKSTRDLIRVLRSGVDRDGRMRCSYKVAGTEIGRWSSSKSAFGSGNNKQNITGIIRRIFIADPGRKFCNIDLEQADSRAVAYLSGDPRYIAACEYGDLHTQVARMLWPDLEWTGDPIQDRKIAEQPYYLHHTMRDFSKKCGHSVNYLISAFSLAQKLRIKKEVAEEFRDLYLRRTFPGIAAWHVEVAEQIQRHGSITTAMGRRRVFFGRRNDDNTIREAVAYEPASIVADVLNLGLYDAWEQFDLPDERIQVLEQGHDSFLFQFWEDDLDVIDEVRALVERPVEVRGRTMTIPAGIAVGYNWAKASESNPAGLVGDHRSPEALAQVRPTRPEDPLDVVCWS